jgi:hypothetical protein
MTMTIPTIPTLPAGYIVTATDMNNLSAGATFLLNKPLTRVHDAAGTQAVTATAAAIAFNTVDMDTDTMWSSGSNTKLTVQTPGFYKISYLADALGASSSAPMNTYVQVITGANNPLGSGVSMPFCWGGYGSAGVALSNRVCAHASGIIPWYMYIGDTTSIMVKASATGMTLNTSFDSYCCMELVSI